MRCELSDICVYRNERISTNALNSHTYVSTENMLPDKGGITDAASLPTVSQTSKFRYGDTLVSNIRPYFKKIWFAEYDGGCSNDVLVFSAKEGVDPKYLYYVLANDSFFAYSTATSKGTKMPRGDKTSIMQYQNEKVDSPTQKKIAAILSALDEKIAINRAINENLERQALSIFYNLFSGSDDMVATELGNIPCTFSVSKVGQLPMIVTDYVANGSFASLKENVTLYQEPNYAYFIRNTDLKSDSFGVYVDKHSYDFLSKSTLFGGEIIISNVGDVGSVHLCPVLDRPMTLGNNIIMLRPNEELRYYLYIWFKYAQGQSLIQGIKGGSAQPKFNKTDFKSLPIVIPNDATLYSFSSVVSPMFALINSNKMENNRLIKIRDSILPKLMSGEIDVSAVQF